MVPLGFWSTSDKESKPVGCEIRNFFMTFTVIYIIADR